MSRFPEIASLVTVLLLAACSSLPEPAPVEQPPAPPPAVVEAAPGAPAPGTAAAAPAPEPAPIDHAQVTYQQAVAALKHGDTAAALELLLTVSQDAPDKPYVFTNLGLAWFKLQQDAQALEAFQQAVERNPRDAVAYNHLGILQRRMGEFEAARQSYQRALDIDTNYALAHLNLGILFDIYLQNLEPALRHYQRYQVLSNGANEQVAGWIADLERRLKSSAS